MTTLADNINLRILGEKYSEKYPAYTTGAQTIWGGSPVIIDQSVDTTHLVTADAVTCVDGDVFMGIAEEKKAIAAGDPAVNINVLTWPTIVGIPSTALTLADAGKDVYVSAFTAAGLTLSTSNGAYPRIGTLFTVKDGYAFVKLDTPYVLNVP